MRGDKVVLDDFTLRINPNEHVAILGPNGCGKSTLVKTIARENYPVVQDNSRMRVFGKEKWNVFELRSLLGIVSNDLMTFCTSEAVGRDVVLSGFFSSTNIFFNHTVSAEQYALADAALSRLHVSHLAETPVAHMSSGEAKRILIARALVHEPKALVFDEPCNSLDISAQRSLRQTMSSLANSGIGIILVTHDLSDIVPEIERVVLMQNGRILADGRKEEMLQPEKLTELFGVTVDLVRRDGYYHWS